MNGISYNGKHSFKDFKVTMPPGKDIGFPDKEKILVKVPFSNEEYDFSDIYGSQVYSSRSLSYPFNIVNMAKATKVAMNTQKTMIINWLLNSKGKQKLYDDVFPGYYFLAEVEGNSSFNEDRELGILNVTFKAYPFMIAEREEGHDIWDDINFDLDVLQPVEFTVDGSLTVTLLNVGVPDLIPKISASSEFSILMDGISYIVPSGESKSSEFFLKSGENEMTITGNGTISFLFYKELI
ncbi:phage tail protein [Salipaludibacillus sp. HK11]|uniref:phage tail protein n=1 Tax=Salipaludibacillus sp. HK11 TaxID=3394320 RepID=UPI0039FC8BDB